MFRQILFHLNEDKFCSVSRSAQFESDYVRQSLEDVLYPGEITTNNEEYEKLKNQKAWVTEHYNAYKGNYSGNIGFDEYYGSKNFISIKQ